MSNTHYLFGQKEWRVIDHTKTHPSFHALYSFAVDDTLCTSVNSKTSPAAIRAWIHHDNIVLGNVDYKLSSIAEGLTYLSSRGYLPVVRNSGGSAVVLDAGVLNLSIILPTEGAYSDIHAGYRAMVELIRLLLAPYGVKVDTGEVVGSYCPGDFDVSIGGLKFGGLAQRRRRGAVAVQAFLLVEGSGAERAELVRDFYGAAAQADDTYPLVSPDRVASLSELIGETISCGEIMENLVRVLDARSERVFHTQLFEEETEEFTKNVENMKVRNPHLDFVD